MKVKSLLLVMSVVGIATLFLSASIFAGTTVPDVIKMETKGYEKHEKGAVSFSHKKHVRRVQGVLAAIAIMTQKASLWQILKQETRFRAA